MKRVLASIILVAMLITSLFAITGCDGDSDRCPVCGGSGYYEKKYCPVCR